MAQEFIKLCRMVIENLGTVSGIFHSMLTDCSGLQVIETTESKPVGKGGTAVKISSILGGGPYALRRQWMPFLQSQHLASADQSSQYILREGRNLKKSVRGIHLHPGERWSDVG